MKSKQGHFEAYAVGICAASVCTNMSVEEATQTLNIQYPTGIESRWSLSPSNFRDGKENGCPCELEHAPGARHYLFHC